MAGDDYEWVYLDSGAVPVSAADDATEVVTAADNAECHGAAVDERGWNSYDEDACSEYDDYYSDYSSEGGLERSNEAADDDLDQVKASPEAAPAMPVPPVPADCWAWDSDEATKVDTECSGGAADERGCKYRYADDTDDEDACSDYSNEGRLERAYESDEGLDEADDETSHAVSDMKELLDKLLDGESDHAAFDFDMRKMLDRLRCITDRRKAARDEVYRQGVYGGYSEYGYGGGGGYLVTSNYYDNGGLSDFNYGSGRDDGGLSDFDYGSGRDYHGGLSDIDNGRGRGYHGGGLSDFDNGRGSGYHGGGLSDFDNGRGRGYYGGLSDFDNGRGRGYYGGLSDYDYSCGGRAGYSREGYHGHHPRMYRPYHVPADTPRSSPVPFAPDMGSWT